MKVKTTLSIILTSTLLSGYGLSSEPQEDPSDEITFKVLATSRAQIVVGAIEGDKRKFMELIHTAYKKLSPEALEKIRENPEEISKQYEAKPLPYEVPTLPNNDWFREKTKKLGEITFAERMLEETDIVFQIKRDNSPLAKDLKENPITLLKNATALLTISSALRGGILAENSDVARFLEKKKSFTKTK